jgi:hypothetical protein
MHSMGFDLQWPSHLDELMAPRNYALKDLTFIFSIESDLKGPNILYDIYAFIFFKGSNLKGPNLVYELKDFIFSVGSDLKGPNILYDIYAFIFL